MYRKIAIVKIVINEYYNFLLRVTIGRLNNFCFTFIIVIWRIDLNNSFCLTLRTILCIIFEKSWLDNKKRKFLKQYTHEWLMLVFLPLSENLSIMHLEVSQRRKLPVCTDLFNNWWGVTISKQRDTRTWAPRDSFFFPLQSRMKEERSSR